MSEHRDDRYTGDPAGRRPGVHPEVERSGTSRVAWLAIVSALVVGLLAYLLIGAGIIGG